MKFRKKPVVIEALKIPPDDCQTRTMPPKWFIDAIVCQTATAMEDGRILIHTLEGDMTAKVGDWIIKGVKGELYPCRNDIFTETYEEVKE